MQVQYGIVGVSNVTVTMMHFNKEMAAVSVSRQGEPLKPNAVTHNLRRLAQARLNQSGAAGANLYPIK